MSKRNVNEILIKRRIILGLICAILILSIGGLIALKMNKGGEQPDEDVAPKYTSSDDIENHFYQRYGATECKFSRIDGSTDQVVPVLLSDCEYENEVVSFLKDSNTDDLLSVMLPRRASDINAQIKAISSSSEGLTYVMYDGLDDKTWKTIPSFNDIKDSAIYVEVGFTSIAEDRSLVQKVTNICKRYFTRLQNETSGQKIASAVVLSFKDISVQVRTQDNLVSRYKPGESSAPEEISLDDYLNK